MSEERSDDGQTDSPAVRERAAWLSDALLSIFILLSVLTTHRFFSPKGKLTGVTVTPTSAGYIIPTQIKGSSDICITGCFHWSTPRLFHAASRVTKISRLLQWAFRVLLCPR